MSAIVGTVRSGRIELDAPTPSEWVEGTKVSIAPKILDETGDLQANDPESFDDWCRGWDEIRARTMGSTFPEELEQFLQEEKQLRHSQWEAHARRAETLFP